MFSLLFAYAAGAGSRSPPKPAISVGQLDIIDAFPSDHIRPRRVYVWLPPGYRADKRYQTLFMHDGQMLFDSSTTWNGQEWGVDEVAGKLVAEGSVRDFIVVAADHFGTPTGRRFEYFPRRAVEYLDFGADAEHDPLAVGRLGADDYLRFLVEELKPYIAANYSASVDGADSFLLGSSMGGLISMYAISEYPEEFAAAACMSTHWPGGISEQNPSLNVSGAIFGYMRSHLPDPAGHRLYFDHGTDTLDALYPPLQKRADEILAERGYTAGNWRTRVFEGHAHDENSWRKRLHIPLLFLFGR